MQTSALSCLLAFYKNFSSIRLYLKLISCNLVVENLKGDCMNNKEFVCSDVDDVIFDADDFYISEK